MRTRNKVTAALFLGTLLVPKVALGQLTWTQETPTVNAGPRYGSRMAYDAFNHRAVLFGGVGLEGKFAQFVNDTWLWDGTQKTWIPTNVIPSPAPRRDYGIAYDDFNHQVVLFGGLGPLGQQFGDTWVWDGAAWTQKFPTVSPSARGEIAMAYDAARHQIVMFGGDTTSETWRWDSATSNWLAPNLATKPVQSDT